MGGILQAFAGQTVDEYALGGATRSCADGTHPTLGRGFHALRLRADGRAAALPRGRTASRTTSPRAATATSCGPSRARCTAIPPERVIGSSNALAYIDDEHGGSVSTRRPPDVFDDGPVKPVRIWSRIGRRPIIAGGNSNGDIPMLRYAGGKDRPALRLLVLHDDDEREFAYTAGAEESLAQSAAEKSWTVVSIKNDWTTVFPAPGE